MFFSEKFVVFVCLFCTVVHFVLGDLWLIIQIHWQLELFLFSFSFFFTFCKLRGEKKQTKKKTMIFVNKILTFCFLRCLLWPFVYIIYLSAILYVTFVLHSQYRVSIDLLLHIIIWTALPMVTFNIGANLDWDAICGYNHVLLHC